MTTRTLDDTKARTRRPARTPRGRRPGGFAVGHAGVFVLAVAARLMVILRHGGLHGNFGYDAGVYFAAGDAFVHGRLPYRDFTLIHPPVEMLALSPFAELTRVMSDESAFTTTVLAFTILGGVNAALVVRVAKATGLGPRCALVAGAFYAVWFGAIGSEYLIKLEPVGNLFFLLAVLATLRSRRDGDRRWSLAAGALAGVCVSVKIWWVVPAVALVVWLACRTRSRRQVGAAVIGLAGASLVVDGPFFVIAPRAMWSSVVLDQVSRGSVAGSPLTRLTDLSSVSRLVGPLPQSQMALTSALVLVASGWTCRRAWTVRAARPAVVLFAIQGALLLCAPSWFPYYADFIAVAAALVVGAATSPSGRSRAPAVGPGWWVVATAAVLTVATLGMGRSVVRPFPGRAVLTRSVADARCVMSDSAMGLIEVDALSRSFRDGCRNWVDVTGRTYGPDRSPLRRVANVRWQRDLRAYLRSGDAVIIVRGSGTGLAPATYRAVQRDGILARAGGHTIYRVRPSGVDRDTPLARDPGSTPDGQSKARAGTPIAR